MPTDASLPVPQAEGLTPRVLLDGPQAIAFTPEGGLIVADAHRLRLLSGTQVVTLAGGFDVEAVSGDARVCRLGLTSGLHWSGADQTVIAADARLARVRKLWTTRGIR